MTVATERMEAFAAIVEQGLEGVASKPFTISLKHIYPEFNSDTLISLKYAAIANNWRIEQHDPFFRFSGILDFYRDELRLRSKEELQGFTADQFGARGFKRLRVAVEELVAYSVHPYDPPSSPSRSHFEDPFAGLVYKNYAPKQFSRPANWLTANTFHGDPLPCSEYFWLWEEIE